MDSDAELVQQLLAGGWIRTERVKKAFLAVDRIFFVPEGARISAYEDYPMPIGYGQTISAPSVVAFMLEELDVQDGAKVLELGTGSGYNAALLSHLAGPKGKIVSVDIVPELTELAKNNLKKYGKAKNASLFSGDGSCGYDEEAPYDRIIVTAGMPYIEGHPLIKQLKADGKLIAPVGSRLHQDLILYSRGAYKKALPVMFVPLIGKCGFPRE
ncbi:protein-L-isoaspartate(D-aspartate) O-methyltransferase [Candidatus Micrarchaeota archaeon]|nr:protein-L-isoaspartate(D-aspartate) O-methyltransferase [Candidatus Micrarchaeota archaeon]